MELRPKSDDEEIDEVPGRPAVRERDERWLRRCYDLAGRACELGGDQPFAAILVGRDGAELCWALNTRDSDLAGHAEMSVLREAFRRYRYDWEFLAGCTLYSSTEPCLMCAGAIGWSGVGTLVYGLSQRRMCELPWELPPRFRPILDVRGLLAGLQAPVETRGPLLEDEGLRVQAEFWEL